MCSLNGVDEGCENLTLSKKPLISRKTTCRTCENLAVVFLRKKDAYCKECFLFNQIHKFRATLGKSKMVKPKEKVLFAFSGSQSSVALLHMLHSGMTEEQHKKLLFSICILFIDEGLLLQKTIEERKEIVKSIKQILVAYNFPIFITTLSECFDDSPVIASELKVRTENDIQLSKLFDNLKSMSSKEDLLHILRQKLLINAAKMINCNKIFTAEVGTILAVKLLTNFSLGRGDQALFETSFFDSHHQQFKILRPLKDFTKKEIVFYNKFYNLEAVNIPALISKAFPNISIQKLTEKFVTELQEEYPSTVYTIFRTGEKLNINTEYKEDKSVCLLCKKKIEINKNKSNYTAVEAGNFSLNMSRKMSDNCLKEKEICLDYCSFKKKTEITKIKLKKLVCYGCSLIISDLEYIECLPKEFIQSAIQKTNVETMKDQIAEFLILPLSELEV